MIDESNNQPTDQHVKEYHKMQNLTVLKLIN